MYFFLKKWTFNYKEIGRHRIRFEAIAPFAPIKPALVAGIVIFLRFPSTSKTDQVIVVQIFSHVKLLYHTCHGAYSVMPRHLNEPLTPAYSVHGSHSDGCCINFLEDQKCCLLTM